MAYNMNSAMDVHKYYGGSGTFADRRRTWEELGLGSAAEYQGTATQNAQLVSAMNQYSGLTRPAAQPAAASSPATAGAAPSSSSAQPAAATYKSQSDELQQKLAAIAPFTYDAASDPMYQQYAAQYERNGRRAMEDTLGQVASRTGGLASSYAAAVAQQQYQRYMTDLDNIVPQLEQIAYSRYRDAQSDARQEIATQRSLEQTEYKNLADLIENSGYQPTAEELYAAGMTTERANALRQTYLLAQQAAAVKASGSGGSGSSASKKAADNTPDYSKVRSGIDDIIYKGNYDTTNPADLKAIAERVVNKYDDGTEEFNDFLGDYIINGKSLLEWGNTDIDTKVTLSKAEQFYKNNPAKFLDMFGAKRFREVYGARAEQLLKQLNA